MFFSGENTGFEELTLVCFSGPSIFNKDIFTSCDCSASDFNPLINEGPIIHILLELKGRTPKVMRYMEH